MATYTDNYNLIKPSYGEIADIQPLNNNFTKIDEVMHDSQISLAPAFDQTQAYSAGDVVMYELLMYEFIDSKAAGNWDATKVRRTTAAQTGSGSRTYGTASGQPAAFPDGSDNPLEACNVVINPVQDLHGYSKPWAGGAGKNKIDISNPDYPNTVIDASGNMVANSFYNTWGFDGSQIYTLNLTAGSGFDGVRYVIQTNGVNVRYYSADVPLTINASNADKVYICLIKNNLGSNVQLEIGSTSTTYEPYANICPITPRDEVNITVSATQGGAGEDTQISLGRNVYGGTLNVKTGELTVDKISINMSDISWIDNTVSGYQRFRSSGTIANSKSSQNTKADIISSIFDTNNHAITQTSGDGLCIFSNYIYVRSETTLSKTDFETLINGQTVTYTLATPQTYTLTPAEVRSILGQNYIEADSGEIEVVYIRDLNSCLADIIRRLEALEQANAGNRSAGTLSLRGAAKTAPDETEEEQKTEEPQEVKEEPQEKPEENPEEKQPEEEEETKR